MIKISKKLIILLTSIILFFTNISFANNDMAKSLKQLKLVGKNRYETAVKVSKSGWNKANNVILVNSNALSDALIVTPLAKVKDAPILLIDKNSIPEDTRIEINRLGAKNITLIGGEGVISSNVENQLKKEGYNVTRIGGNDRVQTSINVANELNRLEYFEDVVVVNGYKGLADATSIAAISGSNTIPILYTNGSNLNGIKKFIEQNADNVYIVGSTSVVSTGLESELKRADLKVERLGGKDRKDTNAKVINKFYNGVDLNCVFVVKDGSEKESELVDGLAVGVLAAKLESPVILASDGLSKSQQDFLRGKDVIVGVQVGGGANDKSYNEAINILKNPPIYIYNDLSSSEIRSIEKFLDIFIQDYVLFYNYDINDSIDKGRLLEFAFHSLDYSEIDTIDDSVDFDKFMDKRTVNLSLVKKHIYDCFGISIDMKVGDKYYYTNEKGVLNTFTVLNNGKVMRYGGFEDRGSYIAASDISYIYKTSNNEYIVYYEEYVGHGEDNMWYESKHRAVIKKVANGKYNLLRAEKLS